MDLVVLIRYGTPIILLGLIISHVRLTTMVSNLQNSVWDMRNSVVWSNQYDEHVKDIDRRLGRLEAESNGKR